MKNNRYEYNLDTFNYMYLCKCKKLCTGTKWYQGFPIYTFKMKCISR